MRFANIILEINALYPNHELHILTEDVSEERLAVLKYVHKVKLNIPRLLKPLGQIYVGLFIGGTSSKSKNV
ncbi:MAG: hypothetical protein R2822_20730 [Spirosomataceae bacterium]